MLFLSLLSSCLLSAGFSGFAITHEHDSLDAVTITADKGTVVSRTDTLSLKNIFSVSEILYRSPGLYVGDYGGFSGIKTVSLRGAGSPHTSIYVDGIRVGNVQSGQNDLGMLGIENYSSVVIDYAQNSLMFNTDRPDFTDRPVSVSVRLSGGSFGTLLPMARADFRLSESLAMSANVAGVFSKGDYTYADGEKRVNNDISQLKTGADLFGIMEGGDFHIKTYFNIAERGTPGSVTWPSKDRQKDMNAFVQGLLRKSFTHSYLLNTSAKASYDIIEYNSSWGDNCYAQTELQYNSSHLIKLSRRISLSMAADIMWDDLKSDVYEASRLTFLSALSTSFTSERIKADIAVEYCMTSDKDALSRHVLSPSLSARYELSEGFYLVMFGRRASRMPTFNELYYVGYGNPELRPEDAWLVDAGVDFNKRITESLSLKIMGDIFLNHISDKITSAPLEDDPNIWLPYNIGKVRSSGIDSKFGLSWSKVDWKAALDVRYSYQSSTDRTPESQTFGQQIPYVARHSLVLDGTLSWKGYELNPIWMSRAGRTDSSGSISDWNTFDMTISKSFVMGNASSVSLNASVRNLFGSKYELVVGYPMPGRNFMASIRYDF